MRRACPQRAWLRGACVLLALGCRNGAPSRVDEAGPASDTPARGDTPATSRGTTGVEIVDVELRLFPDARMRVTRLTGTAAAARAGEPVPLDDPAGYTIEVEGAETWIGWSDLSAVLNEYTFAFDGAPIDDLTIEREEDEDEHDLVELRGDLESALGLRFEIEGRPERTPDGRIRIRTTSVQALDIPVGGLMHALRLDASDLMGDLEDRGIAFDGDDLILDAARAFPPPRIRGQVTSLRVEKDGLAITLGDPRRAPSTGEANHLWFRGGTIRVGRMTQTDADLRIVDADPADPFDFFPTRMNDQLAAGYARLGTDGGLTMFIPDFDEVR